MTSNLEYSTQRATIFAKTVFIFVFSHIELEYLLLVLFECFHNQVSMRLMSHLNTYFLHTFTVNNTQCHLLHTGRNINIIRVNGIALEKSILHSLIAYRVNLTRVSVYELYCFETSPLHDYKCGGKTTYSLQILRCFQKEYI